jgi:RNA-binding protein
MTMMLTRTFLKNLNTRAQQLRPVILIGSNGLTESVHHEIDTALNTHELIKIRVNAESKETRQTMTSTIAEKHQATIVQTIGHVLVIYRCKD